MEGLGASVPAALLPLLLDPSPGHIWLIGHGHVSSHAGPWLRSRGWTIRTIGARSLVSGEARLGPAEGESPADAIWALSGDPHLPAVAAALVRELGADKARPPILHGAGALQAGGAQALGALASAGFPVGTLHPICSLRREEIEHSQLDLASFGVEGDEAAVAVARRMIGAQQMIDLGGLDDRERRAYHGACALAANHLGVLYAEACSVLDSVGAPRGSAEVAIASLLRSSLSNLLALGIPAGVTGPVSRGDRGAIEGHLSALEGAAGDVYRRLSDRLAVILREQTIAPSRR